MHIKQTLVPLVRGSLDKIFLTKIQRPQNLEKLGNSANKPTMSEKSTQEGLSNLFKKKMGFPFC